MNYLDFTQPSQEQAVQLVRTYITEHVTQDLKENAEAIWWKSAMQDHQFAGFMKTYWEGHPEVSGQLDNNIVQRMIGEFGLPESQSAAFCTALELSLSKLFKVVVWNLFLRVG